VRTGLVAAWGLMVGAGFVLLLNYKYTAGDTGVVSSDWPTVTRIVPDPTRANLILIGHPQCPCTRASIEELDRILARCPGMVRAWVLFVRPSGFPPGWERTALWQRAAAIPEVEVLVDPDGVEAKHFGARTSGQVLLFRAEGRLLFHGGITGSRGHAGDNPGSAAILSLLTGGSADRTEAPVFGCPLEDPDPADGKECSSCDP
jgi:hypothetical protein